MSIRLQTLLTSLFFSSTLLAADHTVAMKNAGADGPMIFEPGVIKVAVGDTVTFEPVDMSHNSESIAGLIPEGATSWKGDMNKPVTITVDKEGVYVYQCLPHVMMAMVGVIVAGEASNLETIKKNAASLTAKFAMNKDRLDKYLAEAAQ